MNALALFMEWQTLFHVKSDLMELGAKRLALHSQAKRQARQTRERELIPELPFSTPFWAL